MITITHEPTGVARQYPDHKLEMLCLTLQGGGETEQQTANHGPQVALTFETLARTLKTLESCKPKDEWILIDPQGRAWKGTFDQTFSHLAAQHPFLKDNPFAPKMNQET